LILVSGATGFLGAHLVCELLLNNKTVRAMKRDSSTLNEFEYIFSIRFAGMAEAQIEDAKQRLSWIFADINDIPSLEDAYEGVDEVYHSAALVSFDAKDKEKMMKVNVEGTENMVNLALIHEVKKYCQISSIAAIGRKKTGEVIDEKVEWEISSKNSNYAISKHAAEIEVWRAIEEGLNAVIVNPGIILGVGDCNKGSLSLVKTVWKGMPFYSFGKSGYVCVNDVSKAAFLLMENNVFTQRFILVGENLTIKELFDMLATFLNKPKTYIKVNKLLSELAWRAIAVKRFLFGSGIILTKETAKSLLNVYTYDNTKIKNSIGFEFTPMEICLKNTCNEFLKTIK